MLYPTHWHDKLNQGGKKKIFFFFFFFFFFFSEIRKAFLFTASHPIILSYHMTDYRFFSALRGKPGTMFFFLLALLVTMTHLKKSNKSLD